MRCMLVYFIFLAADLGSTADRKPGAARATPAGNGSRHISRKSLQPKKGTVGWLIVAAHQVGRLRSEMLRLPGICFVALRPQFGRIGQHGFGFAWFAGMDRLRPVAGLARHDNVFTGLEQFELIVVAPLASAATGESGRTCRNRRGRALDELQK